MTLRLVLALTVSAGAAAVAAAGLDAGGTASVQSAPNHKQQVIDLLKSIETGAPGPVAVINPTKYTQHNLAAADGLAGFGELMKQLPPGSAKVNTRRVLQDGDFVIAHTGPTSSVPKSASTSSVSKVTESSSTGTTCRRRRHPIGQAAR